jgi:type IV pilus assembly protein PilW
MVGVTLGLLVVLAAMGSLIMTRGSARTMNDSAGLEQQASLVMMQISRQISQAGAINAYMAGTNPDVGIAPTPGASGVVGSGQIRFDTRAMSLDKKNVTAVSIWGAVDPAGSDTLTISYAVPNDYDSTEQPRNCIGNGPVQPVPAGAVPGIVNIFSIGKTADGSSSLRCGNAAHTEPIASNVVDMQIGYLLVDGDGNVVSQPAAQVTNWAQVNGLQICLEMRGDATQAPWSEAAVDCRNKAFLNDGRLHRIVRQTFYLRNA